MTAEKETFRRRADEELFTRVALVEKETSELAKLCSKFDDILTKVTGITSELKQMLSVHENRMVGYDETRKNRDHAMGELHMRIDHVNEKIEDTLKRVLEKIETTVNPLSDRITALEKWRYLIVGGGLVLGFLAGHLPLDTVSSVLSSTH